MAPNSAGRGRVSLIDPQRMCFLTATGAFSPVGSLGNTALQVQYDAFQRNNDDCSVLAILDIRDMPELNEHPAIIHRPHLIFYAGAMMISRLAKQPHPLGLVFSWSSSPGSDFTEEEKTKLEELAKRAVASLQRSMLAAIDQTNVKPGEMILAAVWVKKDSLEWEVVGINEQWRQLTGVGLETFHEYPGLLYILQPAEGSTIQQLINGIQEEANKLPKGASIPIILSPCASSGTSLQFAVAIKRPTSQPPLVITKYSASSDETTFKLDELWMVEVHARIQTDTYKSSKTSKSCPGSSALYNSGLPPNTTGSSLSPSFTSSKDEYRPMSAIERAHNVPPRLESLQFGALLGSGSFADVYAGFLGDFPVAIKVITIHPAYIVEEDWVAHYEAHLAVDMLHENVVKTLDWCRIESPNGDQVWIIQELCDLGSLSNALKIGFLKENGDPEGPPDMQKVLETALDIANGLRYLHATDQIHSDLSTNNVLLTSAENDRGFVGKVTDFGLSRLGSKEYATRTVGTVSHM